MTTSALPRRRCGAGRHLGRCGLGQDPRHHPPHRLRGGDGVHEPALGGGHVHDEGGGRDGAAPAQPGRADVRVSTFHSAALRQLRFYWPRHGGRELPEVMAAKAPMVGARPVWRGCPPTPPPCATSRARSVGKVRSLPPADYPAAAVAFGRELPAGLSPERMGPSSPTTSDARTPPAGSTSRTFCCSWWRLSTASPKLRRISAAGSRTSPSMSIRTPRRRSSGCWTDGWGQHQPVRRRRSGADDLLVRRCGRHASPASPTATPMPPCCDCRAPTAARRRSPGPPTACSPQPGKGGPEVAARPGPGRAGHGLRPRAGRGRRGCRPHCRVIADGAHRPRSPCWCA